MTHGRGDRAVEGARLEIVCTPNRVPRVRIPPSPPCFTPEEQRFHGLNPSLVQDKSFSLWSLKLLSCAGTVQVIKPSSLAGLLFSRLLASDRKSTRLNSSHANISYAVFCL